MDFNFYTDRLFNLLKESIFLKNTLILKSDDFFERIIKILNEIKLSQKKIFFFGNGASCSIADHFSADFFKNAGIQTLSIGNSLYSAISNDISFEEVFSHFIDMNKSDIMLGIAISSSGESKNIINGISKLSELNIPSLSFTGKKNNNTCSQISTFSVYSPSSYYGEVESVHACIMHFLIDLYLDKYSSGRI